MRTEKDWRKPLTAPDARIAGGTHVGLVRENNEDAYALAAQGPVLVVADGLGGLPAGEVASALAVDVVLACISGGLAGGDISGKDMFEALLQRALHRAHEAVIEAQIASPNRSGMATALIAACPHEDRLYLCHSGDVRAYLARGRRIDQISGDHSYVAMLVRSGRISPSAARNHPRRNIVLQALGLERDFAPESGCVTLQAGDRVLLCSDGLWDAVDDNEIATILGHSSAAGTAVEGLIDAALAAGGPDNVTAAVYFHDH
ncbi:MAG: PP2C family protein-serine/threonine phosphatase [Candidatus Binatia bacterium]